MLRLAGVHGRAMVRRPLRLCPTRSYITYTQLTIHTVPTFDSGVSCCGSGCLLLSKHQDVQEIHVRICNCCTATGIGHMPHGMHANAIPPTRDAAPLSTEYCTANVSWLSV